MELGKTIALGRTAELYAWADDQVLKLFRPGWGKQDAEFEARLARVIHLAGLPAPAVREVVDVEGRFGIIYPRIESPLLIDLLANQPWKWRSLAHTLADMNAEVHSHVLPELPSQRQRLEKRIRSATTLPDPFKEAVLRLLSSLPDNDRVCHGDFHPANILMAAQGPVIIDWTDATRGNPMADVARTSLLLQTAKLLHKPRRWLIGVALSWFHAAYLERYCLRVLCNKPDVAA